MGTFPQMSIYGIWGIPIPLEQIPLKLRLYAALIDMIPTAIISLCFYYLYKLFQLYAEGHFFTVKNITYIQKTGYALLAKVIAWILVQPLVSYVLSCCQEPSERLIMVSIQSADFSNLLCGAIIILISWIMNEAKKNQDELALTV